MTSQVQGTHQVSRACSALWRMRSVIAGSRCSSATTDARATGSLGKVGPAGRGGRASLGVTLRERIRSRYEVEVGGASTGRAFFARGDARHSRAAQTR